MNDPATTVLFCQWYDLTCKKVLAYITAKCRNTEDITDIFQETYLELCSVLSKRGPDYVKNQEAFVMKLAHQKLARYYANKGKKKRTFPFMRSARRERKST